MENEDKLFWNNEVPVTPLEPSTPHGTFTAACKPKPLGTCESSPPAKILAIAQRGGKRGHQKTLEEDSKNQERQDMKSIVKRAASGLKKWLVKHICCSLRDEEKGPGIRIVDPGDFDAWRGIVWIDERAGRDEDSFREEKIGCRNSRSSYSGVMVTVEEVNGS